MRKILYLLPVAAFFVSCVADSIQEELSTSQGQHGVCLFDASISEREGHASSESGVPTAFSPNGNPPTGSASSPATKRRRPFSPSRNLTVRTPYSKARRLRTQPLISLSILTASCWDARERPSRGKMNFLQRYSSPGYGENRIGIQPDFFPMLAYSPTGAHSLIQTDGAYPSVRVRAPQPLREIPISNRSFCKATTARCSPAKASGLRSPRRTMRR